MTQQQDEHHRTTAMVVPRRNLRDLFTRENSRSASLRSISSGGKEDCLSRSSVSSHRRRRRASPHSQSERKSHDRHVSFAEPVAAVFEEEQREEEDLTEKERVAYFYTAKDLESFGKDSGLTALMYLKRKEVGIPWEEKDYTIRGLEAMLRGCTSDTSPRDEHRDRVLEEQKRLRIFKKVKGHDDPTDRLRYVSLMSSKADRIRALHYARADASNCGRSSSGRLMMQKVLSKLSLK